MKYNNTNEMKTKETIKILTQTHSLTHSLHSSLAIFKQGSKPTIWLSFWRLGPWF